MWKLTFRTHYNLKYEPCHKFLSDFVDVPQSTAQVTDPAHGKAYCSLSHERENMMNLKEFNKGKGKAQLLHNSKRTGERPSNLHQCKSDDEIADSSVQGKQGTKSDSIGMLVTLLPYHKTGSNQTFC
ncbi:hypothetical protein PENANT_c001G07982 [Penicillium antarcticum]|uniref:Uncharacterized protein n=1 Tax=Penicillium antarcticum TaxID=416450 RepID=A0A1V6QMG0_9EURO|nr:hypothetical protein PENANT_c001G07982 [Penicillium antarcticum]